MGGEGCKYFEYDITGREIITYYLNK